MEDEQDICSKNKIISSIQYQQDELTKLARLLQSEKDREKYKKVIEMSKMIQVKLEYLQDKKPRMNSFGKTLATQNSNWNLVHHHPELSSDSSRSSSRISDTRSNSYCGNSSSPNDDTILFNDQSSRYHTYNGHSYRVIDRVTSLQFQPDAKFNYRRPSADTILVDLCLQQNTKSNTPQTHLQQQHSDDDEEDEQQVNMTDIHIAVRRDASLFKIEKLPPTPKTESLTVRPSPLHSIIKNKSCSSIDLRIKESIVLPEKEILLESIVKSEQVNNDKVCIEDLPRIVNVQKKAHQRIKGLLKRTYQINQYIITKTNSTTLPFSTGILYRTSNTNDGKSKLVLKLIIVSLDNESSEDQTRFGFTFWWQNHHTLIQKDNGQDDSKFALAPDSLVKESLVTWIASRNQEIKGVKLLPSLGKSDEVLRDGRKVYIVYDESLFPL